MTSTSAMVSADEQPTGLCTFLLDRSYSMLKIKDATLEGFNGYLSGLQAEQGANISFTLLTFDDVSIDKVCVDVPVRLVENLTEFTYTPRGRTPLVEAAIKTILAVEESLTKRTDNPRVTICIQTDGEENCSGVEYKTADLKALVERKQADGWEFNFLGSGIDVYAAGRQYGFKADNTMSYNAADPGATNRAFRATATNSGSFAAGRAASTAYSSADRAASGDRFWESAPPAGGIKPSPAAKPSGSATATSAPPKVPPSNSATTGSNKPRRRRGDQVDSFTL